MGRWQVRVGVPIDAPFKDDREDKITENGLEEDHTGDEVSPDVDGRFEVSSVDQ